MVFIDMVSWAGRSCPRGERQSIIDVEIGNSGFHRESQPAIAVTQYLEERVIEAAIRITHGPVVSPHSKPVQELERPIDLNRLF